MLSSLVRTRTAALARTSVRPGALLLRGYASSVDDINTELSAMGTPAGGSADSNNDALVFLDSRVLSAPSLQLGRILSAIGAQRARPVVLPAVFKIGIETLQPLTSAPDGDGSNHARLLSHFANALAEFDSAGTSLPTAKLAQLSPVLDIPWLPTNAELAQNSQLEYAIFLALTESARAAHEGDWTVPHPVVDRRTVLRQMYAIAARTPGPHIVLSDDQVLCKTALNIADLAKNNENTNGNGSDNGNGAPTIQEAMEIKQFGAVFVPPRSHPESLDEASVASVDKRLGEVIAAVKQGEIPGL